mmetsp:Transcript_43625/g.55969  ORF Transcript_43625/g.55969 Transcript_43625/m.55969 type:complete len:368 (-) Transcript_43625:358-1461(-)
MFLIQKPVVRATKYITLRAFSVSTEYSFATRVIHAGSEPDTHTGAVVPPLVTATTFAQSTPGILEGIEMPSSWGRGFEYSRTGNPTRGAWEIALANAETAKHGLAFSSGLAAISSCNHLLGHGAHVIAPDDLYQGATEYYETTCVPQMNQSFTYVDMTDHNAIISAIKPGITKMIWLETPSNPTLKLTDVKAISKIAKDAGILLVVDNTFMSPYFQQPLSLGADIVMHSVTKYLSGHSDVLSGALVTNCDKLNTKLRSIQNSLGNVASPFDCYLAHRGLRTLHLRMERHAINAHAIAELLDDHEMCEKVHYPGLTSHPQHELACRQTSGHGGMVIFWIKGGRLAVRPKRHLIYLHSIYRNMRIRKLF